MSIKGGRFLKSIISMRFSEYDESLLEAEEHFGRQAAGSIPHNEDDLAKMSQQEREEVYEWYAEDYLKYSEHLPVALRNSYLIGYYSIYEYYLNAICQHTKKEKGIEVEIELIRGDGIIRARNFLEKVCSVEVSKTVGWNEVLHLNKIRNALVHNLGIVENPEGLRQYLAKNKKYVELDHHDRIKLKIGYLERVSSLFTNNLFAIIDGIYT